jgi:hypothetical protein
MRTPVRSGIRLPRIQQAYYNDRLRRMKAAYARHNLVPGHILAQARQMRKEKDNG